MTFYRYLFVEKSVLFAQLLQLSGAQFLAHGLGYLLELYFGVVHRHQVSDLGLLIRNVLNNPLKKVMNCNESTHENK
jgi:hypothetical protein